LLIALNGAVVEEPKIIDPLALALSGDNGQTEYRERDVVRAIRAGASDARIKAVVLDLSHFEGGGQVHLEEIGAAMDAVRAAHKPVLVFGFMLEDAGMLLAAHASEVWIDPLGGVYVPGPGGYHLYFAKLLDKLKIDAHVFRVGTYKDYVEPYLRNDQSEPARQARQALYSAVWTDWRANVAQARPQADIARVTADPVGWIKASGGDVAKAALAAGLVDHIGTRADFGARVVQIVGDDPKDSRPGAFAHTALTPWLAANPESTGGKAIGVVTIAGEIVDGKAGPGTAGGDRIAALIDAAAKQDLAALVVRVDSPGGSVMASEAIRSAIARQKARGLPVAVSMANVAASGGYWVSTPGARIFAEPATITGSIGIFAVIPSFERALAQYGVTSDGVRTTPLSGQPDVLSGLTPEVEAMVQANIENGYGRFVGLVAQSRHQTPAQIDAIAQGRVWDGGAAMQNGLIDQFGGLDDALVWAAKAAHLKPGGWHPVFLGEKPQPYARLIAMLRHQDDDDQGDPDAGPADGAQARDWVGLIASRQRDTLARAIGDAERLMAGQGAQAYCLDCALDGVSAAPAHGPGDASPLALVGRLARLLGLV
jgi:protease-4